ncbi:MAG: helix-turn-helix domain-containing protein [Treponema sp.]|jgi:AraC-like DNA-binding protein/ligand-binding sensor protein|nr:helix-turn-helix domain-containing protein [Treponema sp.]
MKKEIFDKNGGSSGAFTGGIVQRREITPLQHRAYELLEQYQKATDSMVSVLDQNGQVTEESDYKKTTPFCEFCKLCSGKKSWGEHEYPCTAAHVQAAAESRLRGGSYIYLCNLGFLFWTIPLRFGSRSAGFLTAGMVIGTDKQTVAEKMYSLCKGSRSGEEILSMLDNIPVRSLAVAKDQARLLRLCAEEISTQGNTESAERSEKSIDLPGTSGDIYPLSLERSLLAAIRRGDHRQGEKLLRDLLRSGDIEFLRFRTAELATLLSRAAIEAEGNGGTLLEAADIRFRKIRNAKNREELLDILSALIAEIGPQLFSFRGIRHASALKKAEHFIWDNRHRKLSLDEIAGVSRLSAPYFSTIFKEEMGECLCNYINRLRSEKAAVLLLESSMSINEICNTCGFKDQSWFSKIFKGCMGMTPGKYRGSSNHQRRSPYLYFQNHRACPEN